MNEKKTFKKFYDRLAKEGIAKSLLLAIALALVVYCVLVLVMWLTNVDWLLWVAIAAFALVLAAATPLFYYKKYRPTAKAIAQRVDRLGLEERLITMLELEHDTSFIALRQREDALASAERVSAGQVKLAVPVAALVFASVMFLCGASMTVVTALAQNDIIDNPVDDIIDPPGKEVYYTVSYKVIGLAVDEMGNISEAIEGMGGMIEGLEDQLLRDGDTAELVSAIADEEWAFLTWSDGVEQPVRQDILDIDALLADNEDGTVTVTEDGEMIVTYYAYFVELNSSDGESDQPAETDPDAPTDEPQESGENGSSGGEDDPSQEGGGRYEGGNQIINGEGYYRDYYEQYLQQYQEIISSGGEVPEYLQNIIDSYYGTII